MRIEQAWPDIRACMNSAFQSAFCYAVASVDGDGQPHLAPIGSLLLHPWEPKGVYFEIFTQVTRKNVEQHPRICIMGVRSGRLFWFRSLWRGTFQSPPAIRLYGECGVRRLATEQEIARWRRRIRFLKWMQGSHALWGQLKYVREVHFDRFEGINLGSMTASLQFPTLRSSDHR